MNFSVSKANREEHTKSMGNKVTPAFLLQFDFKLYEIRNLILKLEAKKKRVALSRQKTRRSLPATFML